MVGMVGRHIDNDVWVKKMKSRLKRVHNVIVDDVRFENEVKMLKEEGFTIIYLNTPWHVRFKRIRERSTYLEHVQYFNDPSEIACENIDKKYFDYVWSTPSEVDEGLKNLIVI
jgi:cytidylate kinase